MRLLSIHWGFSIGGVGKYASIIDRVREYDSIEIRSICILSRKRQVDEETLSCLNDCMVVWRNSAMDMQWVSVLIRMVTEWEPDSIISHGFNGHFIAMLVKFFVRPRQKLICSYHGLYHATTSFRRIAGFFYNRFTEFYIRRMVSSSVAVAEHCKTYLITRGVDEKKVTVIHNGLKDYWPPDNTREKLRKLFGFDEYDIVLGVASRLDPVKGVEYLIDALAMLAEKYARIKCLVIGTGTVEDRLFQQAKSLGLEDRVVFTGFRSDIPDCLSAMDIFVLPSLAEYHSIGLLEAMRAEKVIISTDVGGNTESVRHRQEGIIVSPANVTELANAIQYLVEDDDLAAGLACSARQRFLENFTEDVMVKKTAAWIKQSVRA